MIHFIDSIVSFCRYRLIPTFGQGTIRKFGNNASAMKKLAGRDFEDLLQVQFNIFFNVALHLASFQCAIPVFEGLLPEPHNEVVLELLFELSTWHGFAKMRLHTESTVQALENSTRRLGLILRRFESETCSAFKTRELPSEEAARGRRKAALALKSQPVTVKITTQKKTRSTTKECYKM